MHRQGRTRFLQKKECCAGALEGRFIATLCRLTGAKTVLEVGMFTGTTTLAVAQQLPADGRVCLAGSVQWRCPLPQMRLVYDRPQYDLIDNNDALPSSSWGLCWLLACGMICIFRCCSSCAWVAKHGCAYKYFICEECSTCLHTCCLLRDSLVQGAQKSSCRPHLALHDVAE